VAHRDREERRPPHVVARGDDADVVPQQLRRQVRRMPHVGIQEQQVRRQSDFSISRTMSLRAASTGKPCE
jgi:hypothetical protein